MIAIESFKKFRTKDIITILTLSGIWFLINTIINKFLGMQTGFAVTIITATTLMSFTVLLVRKAGTSSLFYLIGGILNWKIDTLGATGLNQLISLAVAGIIFELVFLILKLEIKSVQIDILTGTAISAATIPITNALLLSPIIAKNMMIALINITLIGFFSGLIGGVISFLIWHSIRNTKFILNFEYKY
ncbi:hypothetical protein DRJ22_02650 [Candidatus Woesearchaeota archaeon]|nr:MAG: hypothetical protein B6U93_00055 [Candidatus Woesearchaeota archaeon ex4484_78]RLE46154.1 MAG: hypothetical protein DRJ22_02650 [Candidatus Woesearchaeota archaeon]